SDLIHAVAHFDRIQIYFHDTFLAPKNLNQYGKIAFQSFSEITFTLPKKNIFSGLLRNRASTSFSSLSLILLISLFYRFPVKTIVVTKMPVFAGYDCLLDIYRHIFYGNPIVTADNRFTVMPLLKASDSHQRCIRHRHKPIGNYP